MKSTDSTVSQAFWLPSFQSSWHVHAKAYNLPDCICCSTLLHCWQLEWWSEGQLCNHDPLNLWYLPPFSLFSNPH
jgi:hypothetical protein